MFGPLNHQREVSISADSDSLEGIEIIDDGIGELVIAEESPSKPIRKPTRSGTLNALSENRKRNHGGLSWRSDPNASFSDWTIEVAIVEDGEISSSTFYHCHSNVLVWGPRKCGVFVKLFQDRMREMPHSTLTQIELSPTEAETFPSLLDFLYCETTLSLSADRICSMYALAERFENEMLMTAIQTFVEQYLDFDQSIEFLSYARRHPHRERFDKLVLLTNSKICGYLVKHPEEASKVPPEMLAHILHRRAQVMKVLKGEDPRKFSGEWETNRSRVLSTVVSECCLHAVTTAVTTKPTLTRQTFERLTNPKHLPALDSQAALKMLQVDSVLSLNEKDDDSLRGNGVRWLSSFEKRCIKALVTDWSNILAQNGPLVFEQALPNVRSRVLAEILMQVSKQYERKIGTNDRHHEILETLPMHEFTNRRSRILLGNCTVQSPHADNALEPRKGLSNFGEGKFGVHNNSTENLGGEEFNEEDLLSPVNRYSVAPDRHRF